MFGMETDWRVGCVEGEGWNVNWIEGGLCRRTALYYIVICGLSACTVTAMRCIILWSIACLAEPYLPCAVLYCDLWPVRLFRNCHALYYTVICGLSACTVTAMRCIILWSIACLAEPYLPFAVLYCDLWPVRLYRNCHALYYIAIYGLSGCTVTLMRGIILCSMACLPLP